MIYEFIYGEKSDLLCIFESIGSVNYNEDSRICFDSKILYKYMIQRFAFVRPASVTKY